MPAWVLLRVMLCQPHIVPHIVREDGPALADGEFQLLWVALFEHSCLCRRQYIKAAFAKDGGKRWMHVLIEIEGDQGHHLVWGLEPGLPVLFSVSRQVPVNLCFMVVVVRKGVVDLGQGQMREGSDQLLRGHPLLQHIRDDRADRELRAPDNGLAPTVVLTPRDIGMDHFRLSLSHEPITLNRDCKPFSQRAQVKGLRSFLVSRGFLTHTDLGLSDLQLETVFRRWQP